MHVDPSPIERANDTAPLAVLEPEAVKRPAKILIADDDCQQNEVLNYCFQKQGFETRVANNGDAAFTIAQQWEPDLVILDIHMPHIDGLDVCSRLNDGTATCNIPIIILSGSDELDVVRRARQVGCRYFLRKPFDPNALLVLVESALGV